MSFWSKNFGKMISIVIVPVSAIFNIYILHLNIILLFILIVAVMITTFLYYKKQKYFFNTIFIIFLLIIIGTINREFMNLMKQQTYESFSEKQNALSLSWIILLPIILISTFILGVLFDIMKNKNLNKSNEYPK